MPQSLVKAQPVLELGRLVGQRSKNKRIQKKKKRKERKRKKEGYTIDIMVPVLISKAFYSLSGHCSYVYMYVFTSPVVGKEARKKRGKKKKPGLQGLKMELLEERQKDFWTGISWVTG